MFQQIEIETLLTFLSDRQQLEKFKHGKNFNVNTFSFSEIGGGNMRKLLLSEREALNF